METSQLEATDSQFKISNRILIFSIAHMTQDWSQNANIMKTE